MCHCVGLECIALAQFALVALCYAEHPTDQMLRYNMMPGCPGYVQECPFFQCACCQVFTRDEITVGAASVGGVLHEMLIVAVPHVARQCIECVTAWQNSFGDRLRIES